MLEIRCREIGSRAGFDPSTLANNKTPTQTQILTLLRFHFDSIDWNGIEGGSEGKKKRVDFCVWALTIVESLNLAP